LQPVWFGEEGASLRGLPSKAPFETQGKQGRQGLRQDARATIEDLSMEG
jgi:hypothetical protein